MGNYFRWTVQLGFGLALTFVLYTVGFAQKPSLPKTAALQRKVIHYVQTLFPDAQDLSIKSFQREKDTPFYRVVFSFKVQNTSREGGAFVTLDGNYIILCYDCIYDLRKDPKLAQWEKMARGADERMRKVKIEGRPFKGNPNAPVVIVEYLDYQCPYCRRAFEGIEPKLLETFGDQIKIVYKQLPLVQIHPWAMKASIAAMCVFKHHPKAYWNIHARFFQQQDQINVRNIRDKFYQFAKELKLNVDRLMTCFDKEETRSEVEADINEALSLGFQGTPAFLINGVMVSGARSFEEFRNYIEMALMEQNRKVKRVRSKK